MITRSSGWKKLETIKKELPQYAAKSMHLQEGWVIANHILVSFHVAFISSVLALPFESLLRDEVLRFIFLSPETLVSAVYMYISFHTGIAIHELGHYLTAARLNALNEKCQKEAKAILKSNLFTRFAQIAKMFILIPYGKANGIKREGLNYYPDAPYNLAVAAAGPRASRNLAWIMLVPALICLTIGLYSDFIWLIYIGRLLLGIGLVGFLDFKMADAGKYAEFVKREKSAREQSSTVIQTGQWWDDVHDIKKYMIDRRIQELNHPYFLSVTAPWQFRNCGMGGRHTEKEYPESNISMQEAMFLILGAKDYQEAQEMTVRLQNRLKEIIENEEGCRVMGIGLEGGLAPYIGRGDYPLPEIRLWDMMKQTIIECGFQPGQDVAIALDPAMSELEIAYRKEFNVPDSVGQYLFWRDKSKIVMDRDEVLELYTKALKEYDIPIISIEDGFSEDDHQGWQQMLESLGSRILIIGDDLVTTNDKTIEHASRNALINTVLIKANQIGTLYETLLAILVTLGKGLDVVVSHRSKSPNDDMEAQIALAINSLGLKAGGGSNTERLVKYHAITDLMQKGIEKAESKRQVTKTRAKVRQVYAYEEPTNAGIPSVGATVEIELLDSNVTMPFKGATPLGTSAGTGEAIHLVDATIEEAENKEVISKHAGLFKEVEKGVYNFNHRVDEKSIRTTDDHDLIRLFTQSRRYDGKGCLTAVHNVNTIIAPLLKGLDITPLSIKDIDRMLLSLENRLAERRGKLNGDVSEEDHIHFKQRKQNLGMNAILSVSLAMARGLANLQGKDLYELLREEIYEIISSLSDKYGIQIKGNNFSDYIQALKDINQAVASESQSLYEVLRDHTGIYKNISSDSNDWPRIKETKVV